MKHSKCFLALVLTLSMVFGLAPSVLAITTTSTTASNNKQGTSKIAVIDEIVTSYNNSNGRVLCAASFGNPRLYPENSLEGINSSIFIGADIVTVSVQKTKDNKFILMTDSSLSRMCVNAEDGTPATGKVSERTLEELQKNFFLRESKGGANSKATKYTIPSLSETITACKGKIMLMVNNGWKYADEINALARSLDACDIIIIRNAPTPESAAAFISKSGVPICHVATHYNKDSEGNAKNFVKGSLESGVKMVELEASKASSSIYNKSLLTKFDGAGRAFVSTTKPELCGGREDLIADWTDLIERGYSVIETDYPKELVSYIKGIESYRAELTSLITQAQGLNTSQYTKESANSLTDSLKEAERISSIGCISLNQIDKARYDIQESIDNLVIKDPNVKEPTPTWVIILIIVACVVLIPLIVILVLRVVNKKKNQKKKMTKFKDNFKNETPEANDHLAGISSSEFTEEEIEHPEEAEEKAADDESQVEGTEE